MSFGNRSSAFLGLAVLMSVLSPGAHAQNPALPAGACSTPATTEITSQHETKINGKRVRYRATVGAIETSTESTPQPKACLYYTAYEVPEAGRKRPIVFAFNGGPGAASLWLHLGALGPKRVDMGPEGLTQYTPARLVDNEYSLIDEADVVMIDPIGTGFSQVVEGSKIEQFTGVKNDYQSVARFISKYINLRGRTLSPIYVLGESYGGIRGSLLANHLQADYGVNLSGLILISPYLTSLVDFGDPGDNYPYATFLPNFATTAWYHHRSAEKYRVDEQGNALTVEQVYARSTSVARKYLAALDLGDELSPADRLEWAKRLSGLIGIDEKVLLKNNLRITDTQFFEQVLGKDNWAVGRFDARFTGQKLNSQMGWDIPDPSDTKPNGPYTASINEYLRQELGVKTEAQYITGASFPSWDYGVSASSLQVIDDLGKALNYKSSFRVFIASGFYDLACPMGTVDYALSQLDSSVVRTDEQGRPRIVRKQYPAGHMMYIHPEVLRRLKSDLVSWMGASSSLQPTARMR